MLESYEIDDFLQSGYWVFAHGRQATRRACGEVLGRLPEEVQERIVYRNEVILLAPGSDWGIAMPMSLPVFLEPDPQEGLLKSDLRPYSFRLGVIYLSEDLEKQSHQVILAAVAHEIAHIVTRNIMDDESEIQADRLVEEWGFAEELQALRAVNPSHRYG